MRNGPEPGLTEAESSVPDALVNLRDVGALIPGLVRGVLLRSDAPLSGDRQPVEAWWPPATVIDLRGHAEKQEPHPLRGDAVVLDLPLSLISRRPDAAPAGQPWPGRLAEVYLPLLSEPLVSTLVDAVTAVAGAEPPVLVHCTAGKDRTGLTIAVILRLVGVEAEQIVADYALTGPAMPDVLGRMKATVRVMTDGARLATMPAYVRAAAPADMAEFLAALDAHDGGAVGWFTANGGTMTTVERLRHKTAHMSMAHRPGVPVVADKHGRMPS